MKKSLACLLVMGVLVVATFWLLERTYERVGKRVHLRRGPTTGEETAWEAPSPPPRPEAVPSTNASPETGEDASRHPDPAPEEKAPSPETRPTSAGTGSRRPATPPKPPQRGADVRQGGGASTPARPGALADPIFRRKKSARLARRFREDYADARRRAAHGGWDPRKTTDGPGSELMAIRNGRVIVYRTENSNAAISTATVYLRWAPPYFLDGAGLTIGLWDQGAPLATHREFGDRIRIMDEGVTDFHATHVAGTLAAAGINVSAGGMAIAAGVDSYTWDHDTSEMTSRAMAAPGETNTIQISNHSYGPVAGWNTDGGGQWRWFGTWGNRESDTFGLYSAEASLWDELCYEAPYFLPFKSAGNDRGDGVPATGGSFSYFDGVRWVPLTFDPDTHPLPDKWDDGGYDTIPDFACAKNVMTVGAINDAIAQGWRSLEAATMSSYSSWGPADDGRIKPDIVANGTEVYSTYDLGNESYYTLSGTSMSSPNAAGTALLLVQHWNRSSPSSPLLSSSLKALIVHTADDLGHPGPDYVFGWGLMNAKIAAEQITAVHRFPSVPLLREREIGSNDVDSITVHGHGTNALTATLCWTDPAAGALTGLDNRTSRLVNDLDLRIIDPQGVTNYPFVLDPLAPTNPAVTGDNQVDNVEQVRIAAPLHTGLYTVVVSTEGALASGSQVYSLVLSGTRAAPEIIHAPLTNQPFGQGAYVVEAEVRSLTGIASNGVRLLWNAVGPTGTFHEATMTPVSNDFYRASIPEHPLGTALHYAIGATEPGGLTATDPEGAPGQVHSFEVRAPVTLTVYGSPESFGTVVPDYGIHSVASGNVIHAWAPPATEASEEHRLAVSGWAGSADVPASGDSNSVSFVIRRASALLWQWRPQYSLLQESSPTGIFATTAWWDDGVAGQTLTAQTAVVWGTETYRFAEWHIDGLRQPDATNVAANPATGIGMSTSHTAVALYMAASVDVDGDGLADWWEQFYFGSLDADWADDDDGDGYLNLEEYQDASDPRDAASVPQGPIIAHTPLTSPQTTPAPWRVSALITDNNATGSASLRWRRNSLSWRSVPMQTTVTPGEFVAHVPAPGIQGDTYTYFIEAYDATGYTAESGPHGFDVAYPVATVAPTNLAIQLLVGRSTNLVVSLGNIGNTNLAWHADVAAVPVADNVESGTNLWAHSGTRDLWHISDYRAASGRYSWYCGDAALRFYQNSMDAYLVSPPYALAADATLAFTHWMDSELQNAAHTWDAGVVEVSTNDGVSFQLVEPIGGYPYLIVNNPASPFAFDTPCFGGTGGWERVTFDLSDYAHQDVRFRFRFGTDEYEIREGWYVDDITVGPLTTTNFWLAALPPSGALAPSGSTNVTLQVNTAGIPTGTDDALLARFMSNDPVHPELAVRVDLRVRSVPELNLRFAGQTSTQGEGHVTISNALFDADGDACSLALHVSTNGGATWTDPWLQSVQSAFGTPVLSNGAPLQVSNAATREAFEAETNALTFVWCTTHAPAVDVSTNTLVRATAWDGSYWSLSVTSTAFLVDNVAPSTPSGLSVSSHTPGTWSSNALFDMAWTVSTDGTGSGIRGYDVLASPTGAPAGPPVLHVTGSAANPAAWVDGTNWWVGVRSADRFGNTSAPALAGPYRVDATPPVPAGIVTIEHSPYGPYLIGTELGASWPPFSDAASGIAGYYASLEDHGGTARGAWTTNREATLTATPEQTHKVYVWARDKVGWIGPATASAFVALLSPGGDFDGDGASNMREARLGTDATDAESALAFTAAERSSHTNRVVLRWQSVTGLTYSIYWSASLTNDPVQWTPASGLVNVLGSGGTMTYTTGVERTVPAYYRLAVQFP